MKTDYLCTAFREIGGNRDVAQLVAHYVRDVGVGRSSRLIPTKGDKRVISLVVFSFTPSQLLENKRNKSSVIFSVSDRYLSNCYSLTNEIHNQ